MGCDNVMPQNKRVIKDISKIVSFKSNKIKIKKKNKSGKYV